MAAAIRGIGLAPYVISLEDEDVLKTVAYAYIKNSIPSILIVNLWDFSNSEEPVFIGKHAVAVTGYSIKQSTENLAQDATQFEAMKIDKLYVHDDQIGPFARIEFVKSPNDTYMLSSSWIGKSGKMGDVYLKPEFLLLPLYHKIRIPFERVQKVITQFDTLIKILINLNLIKNVNIEWDIFLTLSKDFKSQIIEGHGSLKGEYRRTILQENMPKFIWRSIAKFNRTLVFELLFDATDIERGNCYIRSITYDETNTEQIKTISKELIYKFKHEIAHSLKYAFPVIELFINS